MWMTVVICEYLDSLAVGNGTGSSLTNSCSEACATVVISTRTHCAAEFVILFEMQKYALYMIWLNASNYGL